MDFHYHNEFNWNTRGEPITSSLFGVNFVARDNHVGAGSPFLEAMDLIRAGLIRYPGGTVTEDFFDPSAEYFDELFTVEDVPFIFSDEGVPIATVQPLLKEAALSNKGVSFVLPTAHLLEDGLYGERQIDDLAVQRLIEKISWLLEEKNEYKNITGFEIGNEYFVNSLMSAEEYGKVANRLLVELGEVIKTQVRFGNIESGAEPKIAIQAAPGWQYNDNTKILQELTHEARENLAGVIGHFFPAKEDSIDKFSPFFSSLDFWDSAIEERDLETWITEWNMSAKRAEEFGFRQASGIISIIHELADQNVDRAIAWMAQHHNVPVSLTSLSGYNNFLDPYDTVFNTGLTIAGEVFNSMSESLVGLRPLELPVENFLSAKGVAVKAFGSFDRVSIYISSQADKDQSISLSLREYFRGLESANITIYSPFDDPSTPNINEGDPSSPKAQYKIDEISLTSIRSTESFTVSPGAIVKVDLGLSPQRVSGDSGDIRYLERLLGTDQSDKLFGGSDSSLLLGFEGDDLIFGGSGKDRIVSGAGDDTCWGSTGRDIIFGQAGSDQLSGGAGNDKVFGGSGDDLLFGSPGRDTLSGGRGADSLHGDDNSDILSGGIGKDALLGGNGRDTLRGGSGSDTLTGGKGADVLVGGSGADVFKFNFKDSPSRIGSDRIADFQNRDKIDLSSIDAKIGTSQDERFTFSEDGAQRNSVWAVDGKNHSWVYADFTGDGIADTQIKVLNFSNLEDFHFIL